MHKNLFLFFLQRVKSKVGRKLPPARNSTSVDFKSKGLFVAVELVSQKKIRVFWLCILGLVVQTDPQSQSGTEIQVDAERFKEPKEKRC